MKRWRAFISAKPVVLVLALLLSASFGAIHGLTTAEFAVSAFYLIPICWACWAAGRWAGLLLALACAVIWYLADLATGHTYRHPAIPIWNALMLLALFVTVVYSLSAFREAHGHLLAAQLKLERQNERLEETVQQRTSALRSEIAERKRLEKANLQAERLATVAKIAAEVAHEVRNPLGSITLNLDLIAKQVEKLAGTSRHPAEEAHTLIAEMREEVSRIRLVIEEYLQFARLRKAQRKPVALNELLEQKLAFMGSAFENARVDLRTDFDPRLKTINADAEQLWQAVLNLVHNSLEAMPDGGTLTLSTQKADAEAIIRVADTGKGMSATVLDQLFVPFFTTKAQGTGLGMPLTQQILNEHDAEIECDSAVGKGTTFTIHFPLEQRRRDDRPA